MAEVSSIDEMRSLIEMRVTLSGGAGQGPRVARPLILVAALALAVGPICGCDPADPPKISKHFEQRPNPIIHLMDLPAEILGEARTDDMIVAHFEGAGLERWRQSVDPDGIRWIGPRFEHGLEDIGVVEIVLTPGRAQRLDLVPIVEGDDGTSMARARRIEVPLEQGLASDVELTIQADLSETLHGNFGDAARDGRLVGLDLHLLGAGLKSARLRALSLRPRGASPDSFAARPAMAEQGGVLRPSWWVRGGASVEFGVELPDAEAGSPELRWYDGALAGAGARRVEVFADGELVLAERYEVDSPTPGWNEERVDLTAWKAEVLRIRFSTEGSGIGLFGDPQIVTSEHPVQSANVLIYLIDTLRADHIGAFGSKFADISPTIDRLAAEGVAFSMALSHSPWTKPSIATLLSGILPTTHRIGSRTVSDRLPKEVGLVQERFRAAGWRTGSFTANSFGSTLSGLERGFDIAVVPRFWKGHPELGRHPSASQVQAEFLRWIDREPGRPFFAYLQVMEVHPQGRPRRRAGQPNHYTAYAAAVRAADADLERLLAALSERGRDENLLLIVVGDHGDSFGGHGRKRKGHGTSVFQDQIHVPLIFWARAGLKRGTVQVPVGLSDVAPSLLDLFGLLPLAEAEGESLRAHLSGGVASRRSVPSALLHFPLKPDAPQQFSLVSPEGLKVLRIGESRPLVFDVREDDRELRRSPPEASAVQLELDRRIAEYPKRASAFQKLHGAPRAGPVDPQQMQRLRALGYVQ